MNSLLQLRTTHAGGSPELVQLNPEHPGFLDKDYRQRRNLIAQIALNYRSGQEIPIAPYSQQENAVWSTVLKSLLPVHQQQVCREILDLQGVVDFDPHKIPQLRDVNQLLENVAGFRMEPVGGLVSPRTFQQYLGQRVFLSTQYIRHHSKPFYTPEPDIVHELIGHAATLAHPGIAEVNRLLGMASGVANNDEMEHLANVYWYTLEFGVVKERGDVKAFGAGLLSSVGELRGFAQRASLQDWDLDTIARTTYDPTQMQSTLFVAPSFTRLLTDLSCWLRTGGWRKPLCDA